MIKENLTMQPTIQYNLAEVVFILRKHLQWHMTHFGSFSLQEKTMTRFLQVSQERKWEIAVSEMCVCALEE